MRRLAALLFLSCSFTAGARDLPAPVVEALARAGVPLSSVAIVVEPVERRRPGSPPPLVSHNADVPMNPASVMKLVTSFAALDLLGPAFTFHTDFLAGAEINGGVLDGDLFIRGGGDPRLTAERLWLAAHQLRARGVREIRGDVVVDRSYFAAQAHDPAAFDNDPRRAYNVGPDAFLVNFHALEFRFIPEGRLVRVVAEPDLPNVEIASRIATTEGPCRSWRQDLKHDFLEIGLVATVVFSGSMPAACGEKLWSLSVFDSAQFSESVWRWVWSEAGGKLRGKMRSGTVPPDARLLMRLDSDPLSVLVREMNKNSNNVMARHLFLALSAEREGPGDPRASERIVKDWLAFRGIGGDGVAIENGAGLSRDDRISAAALASLLRIAWSTPLMPELSSSMPIFGADGTLRSRRAGAGHAHLKGGTLTGVQAIAGYVIDGDARRWAVVMTVNHARANAAQPALESLVEWVHLQKAPVS